MLGPIKTVLFFFLSLTRPNFLSNTKQSTHSLTHCSFLFSLSEPIPMEHPKPKPYGPTNPLLSLSTFIHQHCLRFGAELSSRLNDTKRLAGTLASYWPPAPASSNRRLRPTPAPFASISQPKQALAAGLSSDHVAKTLAGTAVYTVSNSNNEFVLISDPNGAKSIGLLCFRQEDAEAFLAQVQYFSLSCLVPEKAICGLCLDIMVVNFRLGREKENYVVTQRLFPLHLTRYSFRV